MLHNNAKHQNSHNNFKEENKVRGLITSQLKIKLLLLRKYNIGTRIGKETKEAE